jgi:hypothetical protein
MGDEATHIAILTGNFRRRVANGSLAISDLETICADADAKCLDGTTIVEVTIEGCSTRAVKNVSRSAVLAATPQGLAENFTTNPRSGRGSDQLPRPDDTSAHVEPVHMVADSGLYGARDAPAQKRQRGEG